MISPISFVNLHCFMCASFRSAGNLCKYCLPQLSEYKIFIMGYPNCFICQKGPFMVGTQSCNDIQFLPRLRYTLIFTLLKMSAHVEEYCQFQTIFYVLMDLPHLNLIGNLLALSTIKILTELSTIESGRGTTSEIPNLCLGYILMLGKPLVIFTVKSNCVTHIIPITAFHSLAHISFVITESQLQSMSKWQMGHIGDWHS